VYGATDLVAPYKSNAAKLMTDRVESSFLQKVLASAEVTE
jgi:hypothetical protein